jgi:hypothetical protein
MTIVFTFDSLYYVVSYYPPSQSYIFVCWCFLLCSAAWKVKGTIQEGSFGCHRDWPELEHSLLFFVAHVSVLKSMAKIVLLVWFLFALKQQYTLLLRCMLEHTCVVSYGELSCLIHICTNHYVWAYMIQFPVVSSTWTACLFLFYIIYVHGCYLKCNIC